MGAVSLAAYGQTCAVMGDGTLSCWGMNDSGELGRGTFSEAQFGAAPVIAQTSTGTTTFTGAAAVSVAAETTCALTTAGDVFCWGSDQFDQLGGGPVSAKPVQIVGLSAQATQVAVANSYACALVVGGTIECWGSEGALGDGIVSPPIPCGNGFSGTSVRAMPISVAVDTSPFMQPLGH